MSAEGYGVVAPDLSGYGDTDKPKDAAAYKLQKMVKELCVVLITWISKRWLASATIDIIYFIGCRVIILAIKTSGDHSFLEE